MFEVVFRHVVAGHECFHKVFYWYASILVVHVAGQDLGELCTFRATAEVLRESKLTRRSRRLIIDVDGISNRRFVSDLVRDADEEVAGILDTIAVDTTKVM